MVTMLLLFYYPLFNQDCVPCINKKWYIFACNSWGCILSLRPNWEISNHALFVFMETMSSLQLWSITILLKYTLSLVFMGIIGELNATMWLCVCCVCVLCIVISLSEQDPPGACRDLLYCIFHDYGLGGWVIVKLLVWDLNEKKHSVFQIQSLF